MDKQYKLTDRVSKDSIKSSIFKKWVKRILCIACILSLVLQLTLCCMPINASAAEDDSIVGTWVFNDILTPYNFRVSGIYFNSRGIDNVLYSYDEIQFSTSQGYFYYAVKDTSYLVYSNAAWRSDTSTKGSKIIEIISVDVSYARPSYDDFVTWLKANATKVVDDVYDFTGETRIFNDELTLFNTSDASWTEAFSFNFEVLGVGTADYIILQRTTQNKYTMSYSFDFEDSGGLTMIYRDSPPFDNGGAEWLGGKVNRKVITFTSNPEDPEFQQWLLDNTTLFDNVKDAYQLGQQSGYNNGYEEGFANSLIGDSLSGPINALSQITLIEIQGTAITLGGVVMTAIALCLVLAFLKLYAGG